MERGTDPELGEGVWGGSCLGAFAAKKVFGREEGLCSALRKHQRRSAGVSARESASSFGERDGVGGCWDGKKSCVLSGGWCWCGVFLRGLHCPLPTAARGPAGARSLRRMQVVELEPGCRAHPGGWRSLKASQRLRPNFANGSNFCSGPSSCSQTV